MAGIKWWITFDEQKWISFGEPQGVMMDLDDFKVFNDTHGHLAGDEALKSVAEIIAQTIRPIDIHARYGGEEFMLIMPETEESQVIKVAEQIRKTIAEYSFPASTGDKATRMTISQGIAFYHKNGLDAESLIKQADDALYQAKHAGKNRSIVKS